jgi:hypothetical protein
MKNALRSILFVGLVACTPAHARVTTITVTSVEPFAAGTAFGKTGAYERVKGVFRGELDPADARNRAIVNIDKAPRNAAGKVEYEADLFMLRPVDPARGNHKIIYDVTNRGRMHIHWRLMDARVPEGGGNDPRNAEDVGTALFLRMGYTLVWSGWDPDAPRANNGLAMKPVVATSGGAPIVRRIRDELVSGTRSAPRQSFRLTHEAATVDQTQALLTARRDERDERREIPRNNWRYVNPEEIRLLPEGTAPEPGTLYEFHYPAKNPRVLGIGMAATRDLVSYVRSGKPDDSGARNPGGAAMRTALAFGISRSGGFLRDFVKDGFNQDESARKVFDGMLAHTAGVGGVFLNYEFGQPARTNTQHEDHTFPENTFPFSTARLTDPVTGRTGSLFRNDGFDPLWMDTNTSTEYWQKGASLLVTDSLGTRDVELPPNARAYLIAGTQHAGQAWMRSTMGNCVNPRNPHSPTPALRALIVALDEWASDGKTPPASATPRLKEHTLVTLAAFRFPMIPGILVPRRLNELGVLKDWVAPQMDMTKPYRPLLPAVNNDGNETSGIVLPDIGVPLATYTGWNLYRSPYPEGALCDRDGTYVPFALTRQDREARADPRLSLEERYVTHAGYARRYEDAVQSLITNRLLLREDAERLVARARSAETIRLFPR